MAATDQLRFHVARKPLPKGSMSGFPLMRELCKVCKPARFCPRACGACDQCSPEVKCDRRNCFGGKIIGVQITDGGDKPLKEWQELVAAHAKTAREVAKWPVLAKPAAVEIWLVFLVARPESHLTAAGGFNTDGLRHPVPVTKPDWDKLARAACDALTGAVLEDDSQIVGAHTAKTYASKPGLLVRIRQITRDPEWVLEELRAAGLPTPVVQGTLL